MILGKEALAAVFTGLKAIFASAVQSTESPEIERLMAQVPSTTAAENYPTAALLGDLEEVLDEVTITNIGAWLQTLPNKTFARIVQVKRDDIADDNIGIYRPAVQSLARRAAQYPLRLAAARLASGFTDLWIDAQTVFSAAHVWPPANAIAWSNLGAPAVLNAGNFGTAVAALETRNGPDGAPLGLKVDTLIVGPRNKAAARAIVALEYIFGSNNPNYQAAELVVVPRLGTQWFLADTDPVKPMVLQNREGPEFTTQESADDDSAFYRERYGYKGRRRCNVGILAPWLFQANAGI